MALNSFGARCFMLAASPLLRQSSSAHFSFGAATGAGYRTCSSFLAGYRQPPQRPHWRTLLLCLLAGLLLRQSGHCYGKKHGAQ
jgi:hypothetical protein